MVGHSVGFPYTYVHIVIYQDYWRRCNRAATIHSSGELYDGLAEQGAEGYLESD